MGRLGLGGCCGVMSVCVVSLNCLCGWRLSVYCARRIPVHHVFVCMYLYVAESRLACV